MDDNSPPGPHSTDHAPLDAPRKVVSFPPPTVPHPEHADQSPVQAKILARKPTPFNNELAATIRRSGLSAVVTQDSTDKMAKDKEEPELDFGEELEEEVVDEAQALFAKQMSSSHGQPQLPHLQSPPQPQQQTPLSQPQQPHSQSGQPKPPYPQ